MNIKKSRIVLSSSSIKNWYQLLNIDIDTPMRVTFICSYILIDVKNRTNLPMKINETSILINAPNYCLPSKLDRNIFSFLFCLQIAR